MAGLSPSTPLDDLVALFEEDDHFDCALDEAVHDAKGAEAARINNAGPARQIEYLLEAVGFDATKTLITEAT